MNVMHVPDDSETGYILEVDLEYSDDLHDNHSDYPLAPKNKIITKKKCYLLILLCSKKSWH